MLPARRRYEAQDFAGPALPQHQVAPGGQVTILELDHQQALVQHRSLGEKRVVLGLPAGRVQGHHPSPARQPPRLWPGIRAGRGGLVVGQKHDGWPLQLQNARRNAGAANRGCKHQRASTGGAEQWGTEALAGGVLQGDDPRDGFALVDLDGAVGDADTWA